MKSMLAFCMVQVSASYAGTFHTIIGPDGRPMVVQMPESSTRQKPVASSTIQAQPSLTRSGKIEEAEKILHPIPQLDAKQEQKVQQVVSDLESEKIVQKSPQKTSQHQHSTMISSTRQVQQVDVPEDKSPHTPHSGMSESQSETAKPKEQDVVEIKPSLNVSPAPISVPMPATGIVKSKVQPKKLASFDIVPQALLQKPATVTQPIPQSTAQHTGFSAMGGEQYVNSEYLEDKEFNLEGKKRFYAMPEGVIDAKIGSTRMQMVEREKGVSKSMIDSLFKRNQPIRKGPVALSASYYRVSKDDAVTGLGQQCFQDKKMNKAKNLKAQSEVNVWPRSPLNDEFDFEIVKVENSIQNIQINSYASKQNNPTFYWPFVVFLDENGCVLEGAGGYKNNDGDADSLYRERIEGVIQVPKNTEYLLLTPLATAIDVEQRALTNYGQLKLIAIR